MLLSILPRAQTHHQLRVLFERANLFLRTRAEGSSSPLPRYPLHDAEASNDTEASTSHVEEHLEQPGTRAS